MLIQPGPQPTPMPAVATLAARAVETDRLYFEMGSQIEELPGAVLAWMPGLTNSPAGAVIHRVDTDVVGQLGRSWLADAERSLARVGAGMARIYLDSPDPRTESLLRSAGYVDREELVFGHSLPDPPPGLRFRPLRSEEDWDRKQRFHAATQCFPDGHRHDAGDWVALERQKCRHGMEAFAAEAGSEIAGVLGLIWGEGLVRLKNLVIHPDHRRRAAATALLSHAAAEGRRRGLDYQCAFAVRGGAGESLYRSAGMQVIGSQVEWSKPMQAA